MAFSVINDPAAISATGVWGFNILTSVGIIMVNKLVLSGYDFRYPTTLTSLHFIFTAVVGMVSSYLTPPENKANVVPLWDLIIFSIVANGSLVGMNLSLMLNTVGFYQIAKLSVIPTICCFEYAMNGKTFSRDVKLSVGVVMVGVGICTVTNFGVNPPGLFAALTAVICTAIQQILIGSLQRKHKVGSFDLLGQTARVQVVSLVLLSPAVDYIISESLVYEYQFTLPALGMILLSCILAVGCNLSQYLCIGKYSAVTFQVLGNMKTVLVLVLGFAFFGREGLSVQVVGGMTLAIAGMVWYGNAVSNSGGKKHATPYTSLPSIEGSPSEKLPLSSPLGEGLDERNGEEAGEGTELGMVEVVSVKM